MPSIHIPTYNNQPKKFSAGLATTRERNRRRRLVYLSPFATRDLGFDLQGWLRVWRQELFRYTTTCQSRPHRARPTALVYTYPCLWVCFKNWPWNRTIELRTTEFWVTLNHGPRVTVYAWLLQRVLTAPLRPHRCQPRWRGPFPKSHYAAFPVQLIADAGSNTLVNDKTVSLPFFFFLSYIGNSYP